MRLGIGIMSFDRPHYLASALESLAANDLSDCDVWLFQDGVQDGVECHATGQQRADPAKVESCMELFRETMPTGHIVRHRRNLGIGLNRLSLLNRLWLEYSAFVQLEDDLELSPNCIGVMKRLVADFADAADVGLIRTPLLDHGDNVDPCSILHDSSPGKFEFGAFVTAKHWFAPVLAQYQRYCNIIRAHPYKPYSAYMEEAIHLMGTEHLPASDKALAWATESVGRYAWIMGAPRARVLGLDSQSVSPTLRQLLAQTTLTEYPGELSGPWQRVGA